MCGEVKDSTIVLYTTSVYTFANRRERRCVCMRDSFYFL